MRRADEVTAGRSFWLRLGHPRHLQLSAAIFIVFLVWVLPEQARESATYGEAPPPDLRFTYSASELAALFESYGEAGRAAYIRTRYVFDVVWPLAYTYLYLSLLAWLTPRAFPEPTRASALWHRTWPWVATAPFVLDMVENGLTGYLAAEHPTVHDSLATLASSFTSLKWSAVALAMTAVLVAAARAIAKRRRRD